MPHRRLPSAYRLDACFSLQAAPEGTEVLSEHAKTEGLPVSVSPSGPVCSGLTGPPRSRPSGSSMAPAPTPAASAGLATLPWVGHSGFLEDAAPSSPGSLPLIPGLPVRQGSSPVSQRGGRAAPTAVQVTPPADRFSTQAVPTGSWRAGRAP